MPVDSFIWPVRVWIFLPVIILCLHLHLHLHLMMFSVWFL